MFVMHRSKGVLLKEIAAGKLGTVRKILVRDGHEGPKDPKGDLSSLETNMIVVQILDAARTSIQQGKTVALKPLM